MIVYVTRYALTQGIITMDVKPPNEDGLVTYRPEGGFTDYFHAKEWSPDEQSAKNVALEMVKRKRVSIKKQLAKLDRLEEEYSR